MWFFLRDIFKIGLLNLGETQNKDFDPFFKKCFHFNVCFYFLFKSIIRFYEKLPTQNRSFVYLSI